MFHTPENSKRLSMKLSQDFEDIGVNEEMVIKRRRAFMLIESIETVSNNSTVYYFGSQSEGTTTLDLGSDVDTLTPAHGIRVSELTGKCEKTTSDDIKEAGYSYAETVIMDKKFTKPVENFERIHWNDSKGISPGFRFDLYWSKEDVENYFTDNLIKIAFTNASHRLGLWFFNEKDVLSKKENMILYEQEVQTGNVSNTMHNTMPIVKAGHRIVQLSILAQSESLKMMFDNKDFLTYQLQTINTNNMHNFTMELVDNPWGNRPLFFHGYRLSVE